MSVTNGADYSASELSPSELDSFTEYNIRFLIRYIGGRATRNASRASAMRTPNK